MWLALANASYVAVQATGYDPLFETDHVDIVLPLIGFSGRPNTLGLLLLAAIPVAKRWERGVILVALVASRNWVGLIGSVGFLAWSWSKTRRMEAAAFAGLLVAGLLWWLTPSAWETKVLPRVMLWQQAFGQAL